MSVETPVREAARKEIFRVLRRYRLGWEDVAPDVDEKNWTRIAPVARKIRKMLFQERYPGLRIPTQRVKHG